MRKIAVIPARYASTRLPGKPLQRIAGRPMLEHVYRATCQVSALDGVYIATDDERIAEAARGFSAQVMMTPASAASGSDRVAAVVEQLALSAMDIVVNVQGDQPLLHPDSVRLLLDAFVEPERDFSMATLSYAIRDLREIHDPKDVKLVCDQRGDALYFSRAPIPYGRDSDQHTYFKHLGVYAYTAEFVRWFQAQPVGRLEAIEALEQLRALEYGAKIRVIESPHDSPEVDEPADIERMEAKLAEGAASRG